MVDRQYSRLSILLAANTVKRLDHLTSENVVALHGGDGAAVQCAM